MLAVFAALWPALSAGFIYDDDFSVTHNALLVGASGLSRLWLHGVSGEHYWPLTYTVFWIERACWGLNSAGFHTVNIALHAINVLVLWIILRRIGLSSAWLAAAVFGLHPVHVESVAWIAELKDVLSGSCVLLAFLAYLNFLERRRYLWFGLTALGFIAGLLSKSAVLPFPLILVIYHWLTGRPWTVRELGPVAMLAVVGAAIAAVDVISVSALLPERYGLSPVDRALIASRALWFYLAKLVWPVDLSPMYEKWNPRALAGWISLAGLAAVIGAAVTFHRRLPKSVVAALVFFAVSVAPTLGFLDYSWMRYSFVADRFQYLASIGPLAVAAGAMTWLGRRFLRSRGLQRSAAVVLLTVLVVLTQRQSALYADEDTFYRAILARNPSSWFAYLNLGVSMSNDRPADAIANYQKALALKPDLVEARVNLGVARVALGQTDEAIAEFLEAARLKPGDAEIHDYLGILRAQQRRLPEAIAQYEEALRLNPSYANPHNNLGTALAALGRLREAVAQYREFVRSSPNDPLGYENLARTLRALGQNDEAAKYDQIALRLRAEHDR